VGPPMMIRVAPIEWGGTDITRKRMTPHKIRRLGKTIRVRARRHSMKWYPREATVEDRSRWSKYRRWPSHGGDSTPDQCRNAWRWTEKSVS
jgi:hypothetical protein